MGTTARHAHLIGRMGELTRLARQVRQHRTEERPAIPSGMVETLGLIGQVVDRVPGCHAKELAAASSLDPSTVSRAVAALVAEGLVERRVDPADRRASVLAITDRGRTALAESQRWYADLLDRALAGWRPEEIDAFTRALGRFSADIQEILNVETRNPDLEAAR
ncbi:MarR family winged helix-turn-helix transcriptional regulator [Plantactinospora siamensis]|uniref:MarR family winged helix-turn-helix transcriptional regulator n=1 Tax=Plantactinospora siamensis TaxID=555372 RepID=A0ABV6NRH2_9ACTN